MYVIELSIKGQKWFRIWQSSDGLDTCRYLAQCVEGDNRPDREYRMRYLPEVTPTDRKLDLAIQIHTLEEEQHYIATETPF